MTGPLVDPHDRFLARPGREAEDLAGLRIEPRPLVVDALLALELQVALVRLEQLLPGDPDEPVVDVHECRHGANLRHWPPIDRSSIPGATIARRGRPVIGRTPDERPGPSVSATLLRRGESAPR